MKKKFMCLLLSLMLILTSCATLVGCFQVQQVSESTIVFWYYGDLETENTIKAMVDKYNKTAGKEAGIEVMSTAYAESGYIQQIQNNATVKAGPDVFYAWDRLFKQWTRAGITADMTGYANEAIANGELDLDAMWTSTVDRFRYNKTLNISEENAPIYGLPIDTSPTGLYYNRTAMEQAGVKVISVPEDKMDEWNAGTYTDRLGKNKAAHGITVDVPAKGYFRDDDGTRLLEDERSWLKPDRGTLLVFNDQIAMSWSEIEDLAFLLTKSWNVNSATDYGFYTEWWFNYGWSVGGDCVVDISNNGSWVYAHGDRSANYIVAEGKTYTGKITGKVYQAGETLEFLDKVDVQADDVITHLNTGGYKKNGQTWSDESGEITNDSITRPEIRQLRDAADPTLIELPSIREAFTRFAKLAGESGKDYNICPYPTNITTGSSVNQFAVGGKVAMLVERAINLEQVDEMVDGRFNWSMAPLPVYKIYDEECAEFEALVEEHDSVEKARAYNTTVKKQGKIAGHSESTALAIREKSTKKDKAWHFINWMVGPEGQKIKAQRGFIPNQKSLADTFYAAADPDKAKNLVTIVEATEYETPGDWWYMEDRNWIDIWANPLNHQVRNGQMSLQTYFNTYITASDEKVKPYGNWTDELKKVTVRATASN